MRDILNVNLCHHFCKNNVTSEMCLLCFIVENVCLANEYVQLVNKIGFRNNHHLKSSYNNNLNQLAYFAHTILICIREKEGCFLLVRMKTILSCPQFWLSHDRGSNQIFHSYYYYYYWCYISDALESWYFASSCSYEERNRNFRFGDKFSYYFRALIQVFRALCALMPSVSTINVNRFEMLFVSRLFLTRRCYCFQLNFVSKIGNKSKNEKNELFLDVSNLLLFFQYFHRSLSRNTIDIE